MRAIAIVLTSLACACDARRLPGRGSRVDPDVVPNAHSKSRNSLAEEQSEVPNALNAIGLLLLALNNAKAVFQRPQHAQGSVTKELARTGARALSPSELARSSGGAHSPKVESGRVLNVASVNPLLREMEYAVRGTIPDRAAEIDALIEKDPTGHGFPFNHTTMCNIGNPQALGQKPLSFNREVISLVSSQPLLEEAEARNGTLDGVFKADAVRRARAYLDCIPGGIGAYTNSQGFPAVRKEVAAFINSRDGCPSAAENIFITNGASNAVHMAFQAIIRPCHGDGVLVPIPQYPLYSALTMLSDGILAGYYLDEKRNWGVSVDELRRALADARSKGISVRGITVINPGNPTGQCLDASVMKDIINFCVEEKLVLLADEVYQENVYAEGKEFTSFKKIAVQMGAEVELISFHSSSKGFIGECGIRGGYMEMHNIDPAVRAMFYKLASITLCSNTAGQLSVGLMVNPPEPGDESYDTYVEERDGILDSLKRRAIKLSDALNELDGVTCNPAEGSMYVFPQIRLPAGAIKAAEEAGMVPDTFYCLQLLEATGVAVVPGSGFKQKDGTFHFRTTFLPSDNHMDEVVERIARFHSDFVERYR